MSPSAGGWRQQRVCAAELLPVWSMGAGINRRQPRERRELNKGGAVSQWRCHCPPPHVSFASLHCGGTTTDPSVNWLPLGCWQKLDNGFYSSTLETQRKRSAALTPWCSRKRKLAFNVFCMFCIFIWYFLFGVMYLYWCHNEEPLLKSYLTLELWFAAFSLNHSDYFQL